MVEVGRIGAAAPVRMVARRPGTAGFRVPTDAADTTMATAPVSMPSLLAAQEAGQDAVRDRETRHHAEAMLDGLRTMQMALLGGSAQLSLADLRRGAPIPADPRLEAVQRALFQRIAVEAARTRAAATA